VLWATQQGLTMHEFIIVQTGPRSWAIAQRHTQLDNNEDVYEIVAKPFRQFFKASIACYELRTIGDIEKCSEATRKMFRTVS
jgi:hypothetical protein